MATVGFVFAGMPLQYRAQAFSGEKIHPELLQIRNTFGTKIDSPANSNSQEDGLSHDREVTHNFSWVNLGIKIRWSLGDIEFGIPSSVLLR